MNILLIEDNRDLAHNIYEFFLSKGHEMDMAWDGISGLHLASTNSYDVLILDWMLPGIDGLTVCRRLREAGKHTPILMLTARDSLDQKVEGLNAGADDYVVKPFAMAEVEARLEALVRRSQAHSANAVLQVGDLSFSCVLRPVWCAIRNWKRRYGGNPYQTGKPCGFTCMPCVMPLNCPGRNR
jgi:DNA-binding response OmpR family regulator